MEEVFVCGRGDVIKKPRMKSTTQKFFIRISFFSVFALMTWQISSMGQILVECDERALNQ